MVLQNVLFWSDTWPDAYCRALPEMGVVRDELSADYLRLSDIASDTTLCGRAMSQELRIDDDLDARGCGAFLLNRLSYELGRAIAALDLTGHHISHLSADHIWFKTQVASLTYLGQDYPYLKTEFIFPPCYGADFAHDAAETSRVIESIFTPVVRGVCDNCKLSVGALWRVVADGIAAAYLELGKESDNVEVAKQRAIDILQVQPSPLFNKQVGFIDVTLSADQTPDGSPVTETFRKRGGCCRYYTTKRSEGAFCATCVHVKNPTVQLREILRARAMETVAGA